MKSEKLLMLKYAFEKSMVLKMGDMRTLFEGTAMRSIIRYLNELGYYSSYNFKGMYYTLSYIPEFDQHGLWRYSEAMFSRNGSLKETIVFLVSEADAGATGDELSAILKISVKNALTELSASKVISRGKSAGVYVYYSNDLTRKSRQEEARRERTQGAERDTAIDPHDAVEVLAAYIKGIRTPEKITAHLRYKGRNVSGSKVASIFRRYDLEYDPSGKKKPV